MNEQEMRELMDELNAFAHELAEFLDLPQEMCFDLLSILFDQYGLERQEEF